MVRSIVAAVLLALFAPLFAQPTPEGTWLGTLEINTLKIRIVFHIARDGDGYASKLDSPDQGVAGIPVQTTTFAGATLKLEMPDLKAEFEGKLSEDGKKLVGEFRQAGASLPLTLEKTDRIEEPKRPQTPQPPFPYTSEDIEFRNDAEGHKLAGTITIPDGEGPFPAVVLVSGSGPQDRDEFLLGHRPFLVIADYLSRRGIAVLRFDDRGVGKSGGVFGTATTEHFTNDALAAVAYLTRRNEVDAKRIGVMGHSEGGLVAPNAATKSSDVAFVIMLAGPGVPGTEILRLQQRMIANVAGGTPEDIELQSKLWDKVVERLHTLKEGDGADELKKVIEEFLGDDESKQAFKEQWLSAMDGLMTPWFRHFLTFDPRDTLRKVGVPVLAINGEFDLQVAPEQNLPEIEKALREGGNKDVTIKELPGLNHLFQPTETGSPSEYAQIEETFSPKALQLIMDWIRERFAK